MGDSWVYFFGWGNLGLVSTHVSILRNVRLDARGSDRRAKHLITMKVTHES